MFAVLFAGMSTIPVCFAEELQLSTTSVPAPGRAVKSVYAGANYSAILYNNGMVSTFGANNFGQLGHGTNEGVNVPTDIEGLTDVDTLSTGQYHVFAIKEDGTVWSWGRNNFGQLGDGTRDDKNEPVPISFISDIKSISAGNDHSAIVKTDGTVWCWGGNFHGQLGNGEFGDIFSPVLEPTQSLNLTDVKDVFAGLLYTFALTNDGTLFSWGFNSQGQLGDGTKDRTNTPVQVLTDVKKFALGKRAHAFALKNDGTIWAWGENNHGELGDGTTNSSTSPIQITGLEGVMDIAPGEFHTVILKEDGTVWAWGDNSKGQLGNGTSIDSLVPVQVEGLSNIVSIATGNNHTIAIGSDGSVWGWGDNSSGQLGDGTNENKNLPVKIIEGDEEELTTYTLTLLGEGLSSEPAAGEIEANTEVTITVTVPEGKQVESFMVNGVDKKAELVDGKYTFVITEDTEVTVTYSEIPRYELRVEESDEYELEETKSGLMLTINQAGTGFKHFGATVRSLVEESLGQLTVVFTHLRDNIQDSLNSVLADFDAKKISVWAGFNVEPGDIIKVFLVDELTNGTDRNPIILK
jgi:alpha-tubulin suppressor-like RCC1 family protein